MARRERGLSASAADGGGGKAAELKEKLRGLVKAIVENDDYTTRHAEDAIATLSTLRDLKRASPSSFDDFSFPVPPEFRCPISTELMTDPVILATGQTYDRAYIQRWLNEGHRTCPQTQQVLSQAPLFIAVLPSAHVATTVSTLRHFPAMKLMEAVLCNVFETVLKIFERKSSAFAD